MTKLYPSRRFIGAEGLSRPVHLVLMPGITAVVLCSSSYPKSRDDREIARVDLSTDTWQL
jgi:hypothetical protein